MSGFHNTKHKITVKFYRAAYNISNYAVIGGRWKAEPNLNFIYDAKLQNNKIFILSAYTVNSGINLLIYNYTMNTIASYSISSGNGKFVDNNKGKKLVS